jgi:hypothetical protein
MPLRDAGISAIGRVSEMGSPHERGRALARMEGRGHLPSVYTTPSNARWVGIYRRQNGPSPAGWDAGWAGAV